MPLDSLLYRCTLPVLKRIRSSRTVLRLTLGVRIPPGVRVSYDPTTLLLARVVPAEAQASDRRALEVGVGEGALVSLALARHPGLATGLELSGCDCVARRVDSARRVATHNGVSLRLFESDLFGAAPPGDRYDLVYFNPPYVPTGVGDRLQMSARLTDERTMWDGGDDGLAVLRRFLADAPPRLTPTGRVVFGVQHVFVSDAAVRDAVGASPLRLVRRETRWPLPAAAYVCVAR